MLTDRQIKTLKATGKDQLIADGGGLYLRVMVTGNKVFLYRSTKLGKTKWTTLGKYPDLPLAEARKRAEELKSAGSPTAMTVSDAVVQFMVHVRKAYKRPEQIEARFERDIIPTIGKRKLQSVTRSDVNEVLQSIVDRNSPVAANRTLADVKHLFAYCSEKGWIPSNPTAGITRRVVGGREKAKDRTLSFDEIKQFIHVLYTGRYADLTKVALGVLMLTGQRPSEVLGFSDSELRGVWWIIPKERTKSGREQKVYVSPQVRALLRRWEDNSYDHRTLDRAVKRMGLGFTPHDLRRTMATRLADLGVMPHVIEKMLNHQMEGVMAVYNHAEYLPERQAAWRMWGVTLAKLRREVLAELRHSQRASG